MASHLQTRIQRNAMWSTGRASIYGNGVCVRPLASVTKFNHQLLLLPKVLHAMDHGAAQDLDSKRVMCKVGRSR